MTLQRYEIFRNVVQIKNLTKTGNELNLTQSTVSHAIKSLEEEFGFRLIIRNRTGIKLTREGEKVYEYSLKVLKANDNLMQEVSALKGFETGTVKVGIFTSVATNWIPSILKNFKVKYPGISVELLEGDYKSLEKAVKSGDLDCCFTIDSNNKNIDFIPLKKDKLFCIVSSQNPLSKQKYMKIKQLEEYALIQAQKGWDYLISDFFKIHNISPHIKYEISDDQSIIALVKADFGINIRPELVLKNAQDGITALEFETDTHRLIGIGTTEYASPATKSFVSVVTELYQSI